VAEDTQLGEHSQFDNVNDHPSHPNPIVPFIRQQGFFLLDGGLATALEARGCDLNDRLWSARVLLENPAVIREVNLDFLAAGADCIATATYQATFPGLRRRGLTDGEATELMRESVELTVGARDEFWSQRENRPGRLRPLVAASIGPYGAYLADGSEYTGDYGISAGDLYEFHERRWRILAESGVDLLACETVPSRLEAAVLLRLLDETPGRWAWLSFSCRDAVSLSDGSRLEDVVRECDGASRLAAIGINCTPPQFISSLIGEARQATQKPVMVYPNSGEGYEASTKAWTATPADVDLTHACADWVRAGATVIGGCCRVDARQIHDMRKRLLDAEAGPDE